MVLTASLRLKLGLVACFASSLTFTSVTAQDDREDLGAVLRGNRNLSRFYDLIQEYPEILLKLPNYDGVTIVAPSNEAFENIQGTPLNEVWDPEDASIAVPVLEYHILQGTISTGALELGPSVFTPSLLHSDSWSNVTSGQNVIINKQPGDVIVFTSAEGARTTQQEGDVRFAGGLLHVVDNLLIPPTRLENTLEAFQLQSFLGALFAADLMPSAAEYPNVTIFAPRDQAFQLVGGALASADEETLRRVMGYHIVPDAILSSSELLNGTSLDTRAQGADGSRDRLSVRRSGNNLYINSAQVLQSNILLANGVLHIVDNVLNPDAEESQPDPEVASQVPVWPVSSVSASEVPFTSAIPCSTDCPSSSTVSASAAGSGSGSANADGSASETTAAATTTATTSGNEAVTESPDGAAPRCTGNAVGFAAGVLGAAGLAALL